MAQEDRGEARHEADLKRQRAVSLGLLVLALFLLALTVLLVAERESQRVTVVCGAGDPALSSFSAPPAAPEADILPPQSIEPLWPRHQPPITVRERTKIVPPVVNPPDIPAITLWVDLEQETFVWPTIGEIVTESPWLLVGLVPGAGTTPSGGGSSFGGGSTPSVVSEPPTLALSLLGMGGVLLSAGRRARTAGRTGRVDAGREAE